MLLGFGAEPLQMPDRQLSLRHGCGASRSRQPGPLPEDHQIEQGVSHQPVASVQSAGRFSCHEQISHVGFRIRVDLHSAVLIMQRRENQHRILANVDIESLELQHHRREMFFHRPRALRRIEQRGIKPDADAPRHGADTAALFTFPNNRRGHDIAGIQLVDEPFPLRIDQMAAF